MLLCVRECRLIDSSVEKTELEIALCEAIGEIGAVHQLRARADDVQLARTDMPRAAVRGWPPLPIRENEAT